MTIGKFNKFFAKHGKVAWSIIFLLIGLPMVFVFGNFSLGSSLGGGGVSNKIAIVEGDELTIPEFTSHVRDMEVMRNLNATDPNQMVSYDLNRNEQLWELISKDVFFREFLANKINEEGLSSVSSAETAQFLTQMEALQDEGKPSRAKLENFVNVYATNLGVSKASLYAHVKNIIATNRLSAPLYDASTSPTIEAAISRIPTFMTASLYTATISMDNLAELEPITDSDVVAYYEENKDGELQLPEKRDVAFLMADVSHAMPKFEGTDEEAAAYYKEHSGEFTEKSFKAQAIEINVPYQEGDERKAKIALVNQVLEKAQEGEDFEALVLAHSDAADKEESKGLVENAKAYELPWGYEARAKAAGDVFKVEGDKTYIIKLLDVAEVPRTFEETKAEILGIMRGVKRAEHYNEEAHKLFEQSYDKEYKFDHVRISASPYGDIQQIQAKIADISAAFAANTPMGELASKYRDDREVNVTPGDIWRKFSYGVAPKSVMQKLETMKDGEVSRPIPVESPYSYEFHIIRRNEMREGKVSFDEMSSVIYRELEDRERVRLLSEYTSKINGLLKELKNTGMTKIPVSATDKLAELEKRVGAITNDEAISLVKQSDRSRSDRVDGLAGEAYGWLGRLFGSTTADNAVMTTLLGGTNDTRARNTVGFGWITGITEPTAPELTDELRKTIRETLEADAKTKQREDRIAAAKKAVQDVLENKDSNENPNNVMEPFGSSFGINEVTVKMSSSPGGKDNPAARQAIFDSNGTPVITYKDGEKEIIAIVREIRLDKVGLYAQADRESTAQTAAYALGSSWQNKIRENLDVRLTKSWQHLDSDEKEAAEQPAEATN